MKCGNCGELTKKDICVSSSEKCKVCERVGTVTVISGTGRPLTEIISAQGEYVPLMELDCNGYEPVEFMFGSGWMAESMAGTIFEDIDLIEGEFAEYDEEEECPVAIYNLHAKFDVKMSEAEAEAKRLRWEEWIKRSGREWAARQRAYKKLNAFYY